MNLFSFIFTSGSWQTLVLTMLNLVATVALVFLAYYALRIYLHMRLGRLERGWKLIAQGIIFMSLGFFFITVQHALSRDSLLYFYLDSAGTVLSLIGIVVMLVGLHSHYTVWHRSFKSSKPELQNKNEGDVIQG